MKVTRIACSGGVNVGKYGELVELARRLGRVRSATRRTGTIPGAGARLAQVFGAGVLITAVIAGWRTVGPNV